MVPRERRRVKQFRIVSAKFPAVRQQNDVRPRVGANFRAGVQRKGARGRDRRVPARSLPPTEREPEQRRNAAAGSVATPGCAPESGASPEARETPAAGRAPAVGYEIVPPRLESGRGLPSSTLDFLGISPGLPGSLPSHSLRPRRRSGHFPRWAPGPPRRAPVPPVDGFGRRDRSRPSDPSRRRSGPAGPPSFGPARGRT